MSGTNIRILIENALNQMELDGIAPGTIKKYRTTGFGAIARHCKQGGIDDYSAEAINELVLQLRQKHERGETSLGTWQLVRRSGELLKSFKINGSLNLPQCTKWESIHSPLRCEPTEAELCESNNIRTLILHTKKRTPQNRHLC